MNACALGQGARRPRPAPRTQRRTTRNEWRVPLRSPVLLPRHVHGASATTCRALRPAPLTVHRVRHVVWLGTVVEKSTAVTRHPRAASQRASAPWPSACDQRRSRSPGRSRRRCRVRTSSSVHSHPGYPSWRAGSQILQGRRVDLMSILDASGRAPAARRRVVGSPFRAGAVPGGGYGNRPVGR